MQLLDDTDPVGDLGVSLGQSVHTDAPLPSKYLPVQSQQGSVIRHEPIISRQIENSGMHDDTGCSGLHPTLTFAAGDTRGRICYSDFGVLACAETGMHQ